MPSIIVLISPQGEITLETQGFTGSHCQQASQQLEQSLGLKIKDQLTPEYFQVVQSDQEINHY